MTELSAEQPASARAGLFGSAALSHALPFLILLVIGLAMPLFAGGYWGVIATRACVYWVLAAGLNLLVGFAGQLAIGWVALLTLGAYTSSVLATGNVLPEINPFADWSYTGTVKVGDQMMALLENTKTKDGQYLKVGESFQGATVSEITEQSITLNSGGKPRVRPRDPGRRHFDPGQALEERAVLAEVCLPAQGREMPGAADHGDGPVRSPRRTEHGPHVRLPERVIGVVRSGLPNRRHRVRDGLERGHAAVLDHVLPPAFRIVVPGCGGQFADRVDRPQ